MDDLRKDSQERTLGDYVEDVGAVLAVGAGAALYLRSGGARQVTNALRTGSKFAEKISDRLENGMRMEDKVGSVLNNLSDAWHTAQREVRQETSHVDLFKTSAFNQLHMAAQMGEHGVVYSDYLSTVRRGYMDEIATGTLDMLYEAEPEATRLSESIYSGLKNSINSLKQPNITEVEYNSILSNFIDPEDMGAMAKAQEYAKVINEQLSKAAETATDDQATWSHTVSLKIGDKEYTRSFSRNAKAEADSVQVNLGDMDRILKEQEEEHGKLGEVNDALAGEEVRWRDIVDKYNQGDETVHGMFGSMSSDLERVDDSASKNNVVAKNQFETMMDIYNGLNESDRAKMDKIKIGGLRMQNGQFYNTLDMRNFGKSVLSSVGETLPGRLLKINDLLYSSDAPDLIRFNRGILDAGISEVMHNADNDFTTKMDIVRIGKSSFKVGDSGKLERVAALDDYTLISNKVGATAKLNKNTLGAADRYDEGVGDGVFEKTMHWLGIDTHVSLFNKDTRTGNNVDRYLYGNVGEEADKGFKTISDVLGGSSADRGQEVFRLKRFNDNLTRYTHNMSKDEAIRVKKALEEEGMDAKTRTIIDTIIGLNGKNKEEVLRKHIASMASDKGSNKDQGAKLNQLFQSYIRDHKAAMKLSTTHADPFKTKDGNFYQVYDFFDNVRYELTKELFNTVQANERNVDKITRVIDKSFIGESKINARALISLGLFERNANVFAKKELNDKVSDALTMIMSVNNQGSKEDEFVFNAWKSLTKKYNFDVDKVKPKPRSKIITQMPEWSFVHKAYGLQHAQQALAQIAAINKQTSSKEIKHDIKDLLKPVTQFFGGAGQDNGYSRLSFIGFHMFDRIGLGLADRDKRSGFNTFYNLMKKRILPIGLGYTALDYLDDASKSITGVGLAEAGASAGAYAYLGVKRITGLGLPLVNDDNLKSLTSDNPIAKYLAGYVGDEKSEWNTYDEQKKYYESGYSAVRKGRYWWFGSSNEFRGGRVSYWEPNELRLLKSNYRMESMYEGSMWKKWSHSLVPNPTNPLAPLFYVADPYYFENMHSEDRPYPISGSTFNESTPWGMALNPIFDTLIKPRKRLHTDRLVDGVDTKALIEHINNQIKAKASNKENEDIFYVQNGKLRSMRFDAFNAPTPSERIISSEGSSVEAQTDSNEYGGGITSPEYNIATQEGQSGGESQNIEDAKNYQYNAKNIGLSKTENLEISAAKGNIISGSIIGALKESGVYRALRNNNRAILEKGVPQTSQGVFSENKFRYEQSTLDDVLNDSETAAELMNAAKGHDYIKEMAVSSRMITGIYGYIANTVTGMGDNNYKRLATSANMESTSRRFWDLNMGGLGGDSMEILRRFIPEYRRQAMVNPLMNTMPDWLPERFRFGDPFTLVPNGEARLPGRGYQSLNSLHPDIFGDYGALDRFKILADIAPYSPEYKFWKKVAQKTITDPKLKEEMEGIKERAAIQTKQHDFYNYRYIDRGMNQKNATVTEILDHGKFKVHGDDTVYKLSGVKISSRGDLTAQQVMSQYMRPGQDIVLYTDENIHYARNNDVSQSINAGVNIDGESVAAKMIKNGDAKVRKGDTSAPSYMLNHGDTVNFINKISEAIGHADVPVLHSRWLSINSPLESYLDDNLYGTSFQSWSDFWGTFIKPNMQKMASSPFWMGAGMLAEIVNNNINPGKNEMPLLRTWLDKNVFDKPLEFGTNVKWVSNKIGYMANRGELTGHLLGKTLRLGGEKGAMYSDMGKRIGSNAFLLYAALANDKDLPVSTMAWSRLGYKIADAFAPANRKLATIIGAGIGVARWAYEKELLADSDTANTYVPDSVKKRWDMQDYFDRLTYIKYMGLFEQAADKAQKEEGVNIRQLIVKQKAEREAIIKEKESLKEDLHELDERHTPNAEDAKKLIRKKIQELTGSKLAIKGGEYTKSAIMYRNAAEATMYALDEHSLLEDIVRALPKTERDYYMEFLKEKDPDKREEILSKVSPALNRALRITWKMPLKKQMSNEEYFEHRTLPAPMWSGWNPGVDLANVEAKVIYNQGMLASDFGIYQSQYRDPKVQNAPNIDYDTSQNSTIWTKIKLLAAMSGTGVDTSDISVEPAQDSGIKVVTNLLQVIPYQMQADVDDLFSRI